MDAAITHVDLERSGIKRLESLLDCGQRHELQETTYLFARAMRGRRAQASSAAGQGSGRSRDSSRRHLVEQARLVMSVLG